jgi:hypothetical protein
MLCSRRSVFAAPQSRPANCRIAELQNCRIAELQNCRIAELQNCRIAELQNCRIAELLVFSLAFLSHVGSNKVLVYCHVRGNSRSPEAAADDIDTLPRRFNHTEYTLSLTHPTAAGSPPRTTSRYSIYPTPPQTAIYLTPHLLEYRSTELRHVSLLHLPT